MQETIYHVRTEMRQSLSAGKLPRRYSRYPRPDDNLWQPELLLQTGSLYTGSHQEARIRF